MLNHFGGKTCGASSIKDSIQLEVKCFKRDSSRYYLNRKHDGEGTNKRYSII